MLEVSALHTYYGKSHVIKGVSMDAARGEIVGLFGRNGAGKTTLLRSITGIQPAFSGTISLDQEDITDDDMVAVARAGIRLVLEDRRPFPRLSVAENLELSVDTKYGSEWSIDRIWDEFPQLRERQDQAAGTLSGGEQQMLVIAQALLGNPKLILLDEPMEGLAPQIVSQIVEIIKRIRDKGITIILVEQDIALCLDIIDRGYLLHKGEMVLSGEPGHFHDNRGEVNRYLGVDVN